MGKIHINNDLSLTPYKNDLNLKYSIKLNDHTYSYNIYQTMGNKIYFQYEKNDILCEDYGHTEVKKVAGNMYLDKPTLFVNYDYNGENYTDIISRSENEIKFKKNIKYVNFKNEMYVFIYNEYFEEIKIMDGNNINNIIIKDKIKLLNIDTYDDNIVVLIEKDGKREIDYLIIEENKMVLKKITNADAADNFAV